MQRKQIGFAGPQVLAKLERSGMNLTQAIKTITTEAKKRHPTAVAITYARHADGFAIFGWWL